MENLTKTEKVSLGKILAWNTRPLALGAVTIIIGYLSMYCTDRLGMPAVMVGTLLMASKIFDGVTDLFAGWIVDNTNTRWGKGRPYEFGLIGAWICLYGLFATGVEWSMTMKCVWIFVLYTLIFSVFSTLLNASETPYMIRAFGSSMAITKVASYGGIFISIGCMAVSITFPMLVGTMGATAAGWRKIMMIYAVPLVLIGMLRFIFIKEKYIEKEDENRERLKVKDIFIALKSNKYIWFFAIAVMIPQVIAGMAAGTYYFSTVVGDISKYSTIQMFSMVSLVALFLVPALSKKLLPMQLVMWSAVLGIIGCIINFIAGVSMPLLVVGFLLTGLASMPGSYLKSPIVMQLADYNETNGMKRMEATIASAANFFNKIGAAMGSFILGLVLQAGGYNGTLASQPDSAVTAVRIAYSVVPAVFLIICIVCCLAYRPLNKMTKEHMAKEKLA